MELTRGSVARKKKVRVNFRKKHETRARRRDFTRSAFEEGTETEDLASDERLSGKGELTRRRTVVGTESESGEDVVREVDLAKCLRGRVISAVGLKCDVQAEDGRRYECAVRRILLKLAVDARNAVVTGDHVLFQPTGEVEGVIERVEPRYGVVSRASQRREHILVANVDQVAIIASAADPPLKPSLIDRFLISAEKGGVRAILCINKADLIDPVELQPVIGVYARLGYGVVLTSGTTGRGVPKLGRLLKAQQTAFAGQSGVGKSSLINAVQPGLDIQTATVSEWTGKGRHTTRRALLHPLDCGGWVVDTPGVRQFGLWDVLPEEVEAYFIEFRPFVARCKFPDCTHTHESGCGVKDAVVRNLVSELRYESYVRITSGDAA